MRFVNPYNFISLPKQGIKKEIEKYTCDEELLTGKFECHLMMKTPLIIPDHESKKEKKWVDKDGETVKYDYYPFMTVEGNPMIPGSALRGVFRSTFEAITDSCVFTNDDYYFSSRTGVPKEAGLLEKTEEGWRLHKADRYADKDRKLQKSHKTGDKVHFSGYSQNQNRLYVSSVGEDGDKLIGYVLKMNLFKNKGKTSAHSIFSFKNDRTEPIAIRDELIEVLKENIKKYLKGDAKEFAKKYNKRFEEVEKSGGIIPVWYQGPELEMDENYYFALSQISRNVYTKKPKDILPDTLKHCADKKYLCPACALFGFVSGEAVDKTDKDESGVSSSRVRFSDAWCKTEDMLKDLPNPLPILSSPRSSSLEFYLRHQKNFYHADTEGVSLAGRKFYWHHNNFKIGELKSDLNNKMTCFMQYAEEGARFDFEVYFDGITKTQLNQLYTAMTFGDNIESGKLCHKIGHAKPLGFGSAKIIVDRAIVRTFAFSNDILSYNMNSEWLKKIEPVDIPKELKIAVNFETVADKTIDYPRTKKDGQIYEWFSNNRPIKGKTEFYSKLPKLTNENGMPNNVTLSYNPKDDKKDVTNAKQSKFISRNDNKKNLARKPNKSQGKSVVNTSVQKSSVKPRMNDVKTAISMAKIGMKRSEYKTTLENLIKYTDANKGTEYEKYVKDAKDLLEKW